MKKTLLFSVLLCVFSASVAEAKIPGRGKGYSSEVSLGGTVCLNTDFGSRFTLLTTHGYSFGKGGFIGLGTGVLSDFTDSFTIPLYAKWSYTFDTGKDIRPYLGSSAGVCVNDWLDASVYIAPEAGVRLGRFFFNVQYSFYDFLGNQTYAGNNVTLMEVYHYHTLSFGVGISF